MTNAAPELNRTAPSSPRENLCWFAQGDEGFGIGRTITSLGIAMRNLGYRVSIVSCIEGNLVREARALGLETIVLDTAPPAAFDGRLIEKPKQIWRAWRSTRQLVPIVAEAFRRCEATVVHVVTPNTLIVAARAARRAGIRCFWEMPNAIGTHYPFGLNRRLYAHTIRANGVTVLANSAFTADTLRSPGVEPIVFYAAVDERPFDPTTVVTADRAAIGVPHDALLAGIVGRITEEKGQAELVRAFAEVATDLPDLHLLLVGGPHDGPYADRVRAEVAAGGVGPRTHWIAPTTDVAPYLAACDFTVSCRINAEPFGLSIIESMLMERPVLVHALGGPAETVVDGKTGWHIAPPIMHKTFVAGLRRALADRDRWPEMGRAGRERALSRFTASRLASHYHELLAPLIESIRAT